MRTYHSLAQPEFFPGATETSFGSILPECTQAGWLDVGDGHTLPYEVRGDLSSASQVFMAHHGGPGDAIKIDHIAPFVGIKNANVAVVVSNQRLSGAGKAKSRWYGEPGVDPVATHTPENLVDDVARLMNHLEIEKAIHVGGSWGSAEALMFAQQYPDRTQALITWGQTLCENQETIYRYGKDGKLAQLRPLEYERFINTITEAVRPQIQHDPLAITQYYDAHMNPSSRTYTASHAADLAMAFGLLHMTAADPEGFGRLGLVHVPSRLLLGVGRYILHINSMQYARVAMHFFADGAPRMERENRLLGKLGTLARHGISLQIVSGGDDLLTPPETAQKLYSHALQSGVNVHLTNVEGGQHHRGDPRIQQALRTAAQAVVAA